jgi:septal ring factor EnvC (AmiA/AmiB activator)
MALRVNGSELPWSMVTAAGIFTFWLGGLSLQVAANDNKSTANQSKVEESQKTTQEISERLARVEEQGKSTSKDVDEIKESQKEQSKKLDKILEKLAEQ